MKRSICIISIFFVLIFLGCSKDDDSSSRGFCLDCEIVGETFEKICEGEKDPDTGEVLTKDLLDISKAFFAALGVNCTLN